MVQNGQDAGRISVKQAHAQRIEGESERNGTLQGVGETRQAARRQMTRSSSVAGKVGHRQRIEVVDVLGVVVLVLGLIVRFGESLYVNGIVGE